MEIVVHAFDDVKRTLHEVTINTERIIRIDEPTELWHKPMPDGSKFTRCAKVQLNRWHYPFFHYVHVDDIPKLKFVPTPQAEITRETFGG